MEKIIELTVRLRRLNFLMNYLFTIGVDEEDVIYDDEHWHDYCLVCHLCKCRLSGTSFVIKDDNFLCSACYQKTDEKRCSACGKGFEPGAKRYAGFEITKKNHCDRDIFKHRFRL